MLIKRSRDLRRRDFQDPTFGLLFGRFFLGPPFEKYLEMRNLGVFAKFVITGPCAQFRSRGLRQNVARSLRNRRILIKRWWDLRHFLFKRQSSAYFFSDFSKALKMSDLCVFAKFVITRLCGNFRSRGLRPNVVQLLHSKGMLKKDRICVGVIFKTLSSSFFLGDSPLAIPLKNLWKCAI